MKTLRQKLLILAIGVLGACDLPDQVGPGDNYCTSGASVISIDDSNVDNSIKNSIYRPSGQSGIIHTGHPNYNAAGRMVLIPTAFPSVPSNTHVTREVIENAFFQPGIGSVRDYFSENSWGQFNISNAGISDWVTLSNDMAFYGTGMPGGDWTRNREVFREAILLSSIDWASVDSNGDKIITPNEALVVFIFPLGGGGANRPGSFEFMHNGSNYTIINSFTTADCTRAESDARGIDTFSYNFPTIWHELGHGFFGLPDRYADFAGTGPGGQFDIMSDNFRNIHFTIYDKMKIGWIRPKILLPANERIPEGRRCFRFQASSQTEAVLILYSSNSPDEFFIVENIYQDGSPRGFTSGYTESGIAIWWATIDGNDREIRLIEMKLSTDAFTALPLAHNSPRETNVLFAYEEGRDPNKITLIRNQDNKLNFGYRAVSPPGQNMYIEF